MDLNVGQAFWDALLTVLQRFTTWFTDQADGGAMEILRLVIGMIRNIGFVTTTDVSLVNSLNSLIGWNQLSPLVDAVVKLAILVAAASHLGHAYFGWRGLPDWIQRIGVTMILTRLSWQLLEWSVTMMSSVTSGIAASIPDFPNINGVNPVVLVVMMLLWAIFLFRLVLVCAERIAWLVVLKPMGPLAFLTWMFPQSAWVADKYIKLWVGWLVGQFFVILAIAAMELMVSRGGIEGYFLSCACLIVAHKAISTLVPATSGGSIKVGPVKI